MVKFRVSAPLFLARQIYKHHVASNHTDEQDQWNEQSYRYTQVEPNFYIPDTFYNQSESNKQASGEPLNTEAQEEAKAVYTQALRAIAIAYGKLIDLGVSREQARGISPACLFTTWTWTTSLEAALHFCDLREGHGAQSEIVPYAIAVKDCSRAIAPTVCNEWDKRKARMKRAMELLEIEEQKQSEKQRDADEWEKLCNCVYNAVTFDLKTAETISDECGLRLKTICSDLS